MDVWTYLDSFQLDTEIQYKKWLDVSSSHFFCYEINETLADYNAQKKIANRAIEEYRESGNFLIYLSSDYNFKRNGSLIPVFLIPILPEINHRLRKIIWHSKSEYWECNSDLFGENTPIAFEQIEAFINEQSLIDIASIEKKLFSLYFNLNTKKYIWNDIRKIKYGKEISLGLKTIFHHSIFKDNRTELPDFFSISHTLPLDNSQARAVHAAQSNSIVISGPPGTGKSQTIINLAIEEIIKGRSIAILAEKKAALSVLWERMLDLRLTDFILNFSTEYDDSDIYQSFENNIASLMEKQDIENNLFFNEAYYKHCIRTLEDYFNACKKQTNNSKINFSLPQKESLSAWRNNPFFEWIYPNEKLTLISPEALCHKLKFINNFISKIKEIEDKKFNFIASLELPLNFMLSYNISELVSVLKDKTIDKEYKSIEKQLLLHNKTKPILKLNLDILGLEKLEYILDYYRQGKWYEKWFNSKAKTIISEIENKYTEWIYLNVWEKLEAVKLNIQWIHWKKTELNLLNEQAVLSDNIGQNFTLETKKYLTNKFSSGMENWTFAKNIWLKTPQKFNLEKESWQQCIDYVKEIIDFNPDFADVSIDEFQSKFSLLSTPDIQKSSWQELCGLPLKSMGEWQDLLHNKKNPIVDEPILKNYTKREIVNMANYCRANYHTFSQFHFQNQLSDFNHKRKQYFESFLKSRSREQKTERDQWKESIKFIQKNWSKKRKQPALFQYLAALDNAFLLWLKPITFASLENFSQYMPLKNELFDTIIIDESSQMEIFNCIPALYRTKTIVVVGDSKQLTPSRFFRAVQDMKQEFPYESILDIAEAHLPKYSLSRHYRSKYSNLIAFSNQYFYNNTLSTNAPISKSSIDYHNISDGLYHQRRNTKEAEKIVTLLENLAQSKTKKSIGIISFSIQQKQEIEDTIDRKCRESESFYQFILEKTHAQDYLFIKNIEQVQGDERDIIIISSGYGKNKEGKFYQFFGPILMHQGENRLNVLMSRAREKIIFITSIHSQDIKVQTHSPKGLILFKKMLEFVENPQAISTEKQNNTSNYWEYFLDCRRH